MPRIVAPFVPDPLFLGAGHPENHIHIECLVAGAFDHVVAILLEEFEGHGLVEIISEG